MEKVETRRQNSEKTYRKDEGTMAWAREAFQIVGMLALSWWILNAGYGFEGTFTPLKNFAFISPTLGGTLEIDGPPHPGNRFAGTWAGNIPIPLPANYLIGMDYMKWEFDHMEWSYLNGEWKLGGWWYYYVLALVYKEPLGEWLLLLLAVAATLFARRRFVATGGLREELLVLIPGLVVFAFVSSQTGFNHHVRYILPAMPFAFIWMAKIARIFDVQTSISDWSWRRRILAVVTAISLGCFLVSSLSVFPHHLSYFSELAGGPKNGWKYLDSSSLDWGQDLLYVKAWCEAHPEARPLHLKYDLTLIDPKMAGVDWVPVPLGPTAIGAQEMRAETIGPQPGWYCLSIKRIHTDRDHAYDYFKELEAVDWIGYTMPVYHITLGQANELRRKLGLPELSDTARAVSSQKGGAE